MTQKKVQLHRGLRDVYIDRTQSSFIDGKIGKLLYRGYSIDDLAENASFEETIYLLLYSKLPTQSRVGRIRSRAEGQPSPSGVDR